MVTMATAQTVSGAKTFSGAGNSFTNATAVNLTNSNNGFSIGNRAGSHIAFDPSSIQSKASATASGILKINQLGGQIHIGTTQSRSSSNLFGISSPTFGWAVNRASITVNHVGFALGGSGNMVLAPSSTGIDTPIALLVSHEVNINVTDHMMGFFRFTTAGATTPTRVGGITTTNTATAFATSSDYRLKTDLSDVDLDRYTRAFDVIDVMYQSLRTVLNVKSTYTAVSDRIGDYKRLLEDFNDRIVKRGRIDPGDAVILAINEKAIRDIADDGKQLYKSVSDLVLYATGAAECSTSDLLMVLEAVNTSLDDIERHLNRAYIETWRYIQVRIGYWKAKIYRPKVKEIIDGAFGRWRKAGRLDY
jgi:hypothetical protein